MLDTLQINREWATRPNDQRFTSVTELHRFNEAKRAASREKGVALDHLRVRAIEGGGLALVDPEKGTGAELTHWSFGQLAQRAHAPAGYLRTLPPELAQIPLQYSLEQQREDGRLLLRHDENRKGTSWTVEAITSDTYGRIWDAELTQAIMQNIDLNVWKVPSASYAAKDPKRATTLYASDRDCFVCLVDDAHPIEVPGTNGMETLFRGIIARNSEVGQATLEITAFLYRHICDNRTIWGGRELTSLKVRHTSGGPMRYVREARPALERYLRASGDETVNMVRNARDKELGKSEKDVQTWLKSRGFTQSESRRAVELAGAEPGSNPRSLWGVVQGLTAQAHEVPFGDERLDLERRASRLLDAVAA
jgi:AraC-like DNA-binding protein